MQTRKAASVLPVPVGAAISVSRPCAIAGQPCACASVGPPGKRRSNQARTAGWKEASASMAAANVARRTGENQAKSRRTRPRGGGGAVGGAPGGAKRAGVGSTMSPSARRTPVIAGIGLSDHPKAPRLGALAHHAQAMQRALDDCGLAKREIDGYV